MPSGSGLHISRALSNLADPPRKNSPRDNSMAMPRKFAPSSLLFQLALSRITSVPADLGGVTCAHVAPPITPSPSTSPDRSPAAAKLSCSHADLSVQLAFRCAISSRDARYRSAAKTLAHSYLSVTCAG